MAAAAVVVYGLRGANSTSMQATAQADAVMTFTNAVLIAGLATTNSPLYTFLTTVYANEAAADAAFRAIGGRIDLRQTGGTVSTSTFLVEWVAAAAVPALQITGVASTDAVVELTIASLQSISQ